jgi:hypothetical protein
MNVSKQADRRELALAVWAAEFARFVGTSPQAEQQSLAEAAAKSANRAVEALDLYLFEGVEFAPVGYYMTWKEFHSASLRGSPRGHGKWATADGRVSSEKVTDVGDGEYARPSWATHVVWYGDRPEPPVAPPAPTSEELQWLARIYEQQIWHARTRPNMEVFRVFGMTAGMVKHEGDLPQEVLSALHAKSCISGSRVSNKGLKYLEAAARDVSLIRARQATAEMPVPEALKLIAELKAHS